MEKVQIFSTMNLYTKKECSNVGGGEKGGGEDSTATKQVNQTDVDGDAIGYWESSSPESAKAEKQA